MYAKKGSYEGGSEIASLVEIIGNFYDNEGSVILSFEADKGTYRESDKTITLEGHARAVHKDGSSIRADKVVFKGKDDDIVASGNVRINRNNQLITESERAVFNAELTYFKIEGKALSMVYDEDEVTQE